MSKYDVSIIGAGPAGYKAALILAKNGKKVCLIDLNEDRIGGTCLNEGCIPAKNYLESAGYFSKFAYFKDRGVSGSIDGFELSRLKIKTDELLNTLRVGVKNKLQKVGVDFYNAQAYFVSKDKIKVSDKTIEADKFIIATGSKHKEHPVLKVDNKYIISSREIFKLEKLPNDILIIGAGAIGCEAANFFNHLGTKVHLCEFTPSILPLEDSDVSNTIQREFKKQGIKVDTSTNAVSYEIKDEKVSVTFEKNGKTFEGFYDKVLISIGRVPNVEELSLEIASVQKDEKNFIKVDNSYKTTNDNIYAIGDVINTPSLAHVAYYEAKDLAYILLSKQRLAPSVVPNVVFTTPQVGSVGESEKSLKEKDINYSIKKLFLKTLGMPKIKGDDSGFVKLLIDDNSKKILGASLVGYDMTEIINQVMICINAELGLKELNSMIFAHPTMSESFYKTLEG